MTSTETTLSSKERQYVGIRAAARELGVSRGTVYYYMKQLAITPQKFFPDANKYLTGDEFGQMKEMREAAAMRQK